MPADIVDLLDESLTFPDRAKEARNAVSRGMHLRLCRDRLEKATGGEDLRHLLVKAPKTADTSFANSMACTGVG